MTASAMLPAGATGAYLVSDDTRARAVLDAHVGEDVNVIFGVLTQPPHGLTVPAVERLILRELATGRVEWFTNSCPGQPGAVVMRLRRTR
jgi:hypothetical protein